MARRVAIASVLLVVLVATVGEVWLANLEPLETGAVGFGLVDPALHATKRSVDAFGVTGTVYQVPAVPGMTFTYRFSLRNDGPLPIQIDDVRSTVRGDVTTREAVGVLTDPYRQQPATFGPFRSFTLAPDAEAWIEMRVRLQGDACLSAADQGQTYLAWWSEDVSWSALGIQRHSWVDTGTEIRLTGTHATAANCS